MHKNLSIFLMLTVRKKHINTIILEFLSKNNEFVKFQKSYET
jgi:hypothetical protein